MTIKYYRKFDILKSFSIEITKEVCGKIREAVLNIDSRGVKYKLTLENPKVSDMPTTTVRDLFSDLTPESVDSFRVFGKQCNSDVLWIEIWKGSSPLVDHTIHCKKIQGLPPK